MPPARGCKPFYRFSFIIRNGCRTPYILIAAMNSAFYLALGKWRQLHEFKSPMMAERPLFGRPDRTNYEQIKVPTLFAAGAQDRLLSPSYWTEVAARTPRGRYVVFDNCGHCPHIEYADEFNRMAVNFLLEHDKELGG